MLTVLIFVQIVLSVLLIVAILLQAHGVGLGASWGGGGETFHTKRGFEKVLLYMTVTGVIAFATVAMLILSLS